MRIFTLDLPVMPFVGCLSRSSFINSFFVTVLMPPAAIILMLFLHPLAIMSSYEVWRNAIYLLFLCCEFPSTACRRSLHRHAPCLCVMFS